MATETRVTVVTWDAGLVTGQTVSYTNDPLGYSAETFTITRMTTSWVNKDTPKFVLELALGDFATTSVGAEDGGPIRPETEVDLHERLTYDSITNPDSPRTIYQVRPDIYMNMDPPDGFFPDLQPISIAPDHNAYIWWAVPGAVTIDWDSGGGIAVQQSAYGAWVSTNDGVPSTFTIVVSTPAPDYLIVLVGPRHGEVLGGTQTILP